MVNGRPRATAGGLPAAEIVILTISAKIRGSGKGVELIEFKFSWGTVTWATISYVVSRSQTTIFKM
jgi:hypothetical protein